MSHRSNLTLLRPPDALPPAPKINAQAVFGHHHPARIDAVHLWPLILDGAEYITDPRLQLLIRRDQLVNVTGDWARLGYKATSELATLTAALHADVVPAAPVARFDAQLVCALACIGAGLAPIVGQHPHNPHAVVFVGRPIGLAFPLDPRRAESTLGVVPGIASTWPAETTGAAQ